ncbi:DUF3168 domain-containing protein [Mesorhizobium xinjiangense]|uniref:DUF3168 domain-containing protein n=1 Tax=Mesorhizobium xinjiangense TaxID=2678685 RepID=UPI0012EDDA1B|nr:DUF3168 domain-containing protein [Mesorhizobium xinjiangense]
MSHPALELQKAVFAALSADAGLVARLGGAYIYDPVPASQAFPYVSFGKATMRDWSTASEAGSEHRIVLDVWSKAKGRAEALRIMDDIRACLDQVLPPLADHVLVSLAFEASELGFDDDLALYHGSIRYRALIETA